MSDHNITVMLRYRAILGDATGCREEEITLPLGTSLAALMLMLCERYGEQFRALTMMDMGSLSDHVVVFINEIKISNKDLELKLSQGDQIQLFPAISGGARVCMLDGDL